MAFEQSNVSPVYVWTPLSNLCGVLRPIRLRDIDWEFPFVVEAEGIIVILTSDLTDKLLMDYSQTDEGREILEVEASGEHWGRARF
jgi:hypothetical protein